MKLYRETALRKQADNPTLAMLDLWHSLSKQKIGVSVEVMVGNRKEHPQLSAFSGELYTAFPMTVEGRVVLSLWLDSLTNVNSVLVTHEIGHWVLKLQGFRGMLYPPNKHCNEEILLNSMAHHPPLYALQRSLGHEPQMEIDSRADQDLKRFSMETETRQRKIWIRNALLLADDLMNCSEEKRKQLERVLRDRHFNTARYLKKILDIASNYRLLKPKQNLKFSEKLIRKLKLGSEWYAPDEVEELQLMVRR
jgi:hypothetical protein